MHDAVSSLQMNVWGMITWQDQPHAAAFLIERSPAVKVLPWRVLRLTRRLIVSVLSIGPVREHTGYPLNCLTNEDWVTDVTTGFKSWETKTTGSTTSDRFAAW